MYDKDCCKILFNSQKLTRRLYSMREVRYPKNYKKRCVDGHPPPCNQWKLKSQT